MQELFCVKNACFFHNTKNYSDSEAKEKG